MTRWNSSLAVVLCGGFVAGVGAAQDKPKLVAAMKGPARVEITRPSMKTVGGEIVTTFLLKNVEPAPIAGLRVEENWYDKAGTPLGGDIYRHKRPLQPGEVITVEFRTAKAANLDRNQYSFAHANGSIKQTVVPKLEPPKPKP